MKNILYFFKRKIFQIKNLIRWFPIIWKQYNFDYSYAIEVFKFQLAKLATFLESDNACVVDAKEKAKKIRVVLRLMNKVYEEEYMFEYTKEIEDKYGPRKFDIVPIEGTANYKLETKYEKYYTEEEKKIIDEEENNILKKYAVKQDKAHKLLWKLIEHNIQSWWD